MTADQIRIKCAEVMGWTFQPGSGPLSCPWVSPSKKWEDRMPNPPDYPTDANAALELVERMAVEWRIQIDRYENGKWAVFGLSRPTNERSRSMLSSQQPTLPLAICEVFLKVNGKWEEGDAPPSGPSPIQTATGHLWVKRPPALEKERDSWREGPPQNMKTKQDNQIIEALNTIPEAGYSEPKPDSEVIADLRHQLRAAERSVDSWKDLWTKMRKGRDDLRLIVKGMEGQIAALEKALDEAKSKEWPSSERVGWLPPEEVHALEKERDVWIQAHGKLIEDYVFREKQMEKLQAACAAKDEALRKAYDEFKASGGHAIYPLLARLESLLNQKPTPSSGTPRTSDTVQPGPC